MRQLGCNQHLRTVWDDTLHHTGERIQNAGAFSLVDSEFVCDVAGQRAYGDDGDGVVGSTEIGQAHQGGNAQLGSPFAFYPLGQSLDDVCHSSVETYQFQHASGHQGDDDEFSHAGDTGPHGTEPSEDIETSVPYTDDTGG